MLDKIKKFLYIVRHCFGGEDLTSPGNFVFPKLNRCFFFRLGILVIAAYIFFGFVCIPTFVKGASMEPTYKRIGLNFCWRPSFWFAKPRRGDIVVIRYTAKTLFLKRVVALPGERIAFRDGKVYINGTCLDEPYVKKRSDWTQPEKKVEAGHIYVVGDNRSMPIYKHKFGQVSIKRLHGAPLW